MSTKTWLSASLLSAVLCALPAGEAEAVTCYVVFDRNENVTYRDVYPPVDLSDAGRAERDAMRRRGEFLMFLEADQCPRVEYFTGTAGTIGVQLDQTLAPSRTPREAAPAVTPAPAPAAPAEAAAPRVRKPAPRRQ